MTSIAKSYEATSTAAVPGGGSVPRRIVHRTRGARHGPITRLMSPSDLGHLVKPFVFLDLFASNPGAAMRGFPMHPHSGIATLTMLLEGSMAYDDCTGKKGVLPVGGVEWVMAGGGIWHAAAPSSDPATRGFQLWVALPPGLENSRAHSQYLEPADVPRLGPARVLLGQHGTARNPITTPIAANYLSVELKAGEAWRYDPPADHTVAWIALSRGELSMPILSEGEMAIFDQSSAAIEFHAATASHFVLGSAAPHPHELITGYYSVHTSPEALRRGEEGIRDLGARLRAEGRL